MFAQLNYDKQAHIAGFLIVQFQILFQVVEVTAFEVWGSNLGSVESDTALSTARHRCDISSKGAVARRCNVANIGPANSLHAST